MTPELWFFAAGFGSAALVAAVVIVNQRLTIVHLTQVIERLHARLQAEWRRRG